MNRKQRRELKRQARLHDGRVAVGLAPSSGSPAPASPTALATVPVETSAIPAAVTPTTAEAAPSPVPQSVPLPEPADRRTKAEINETANRLAAKSAHRNRIAYANGVGVRAGLRESEPAFTWPWAESVVPLPQN